MKHDKIIPVEVVYGNERQTVLDLKQESLLERKKIEAWKARAQLYLLGFYDARDGIVRDIEPLIQYINEKYTKLDITDPKSEEAYQYEQMFVHYQIGIKKYSEDEENFIYKKLGENPKQKSLLYFYDQEGLYSEIKSLIEEYPDFNYEMRLAGRTIEEKHR